MLESIALIYGQMNEPPGARLRVGLTGPHRGRVLPRRREARTCCSSSTTSSASPRPARKSRRCSAACRARSGYQPTLATEMGDLQERITSTTKGSITSVQAIYVPADDLTDPAPATAFAHLDATVVLSRAISELGIYPAVDPLDSSSRILAPQYVGERHYNVAIGVQRTLQRYKALQDIIAILGMDELSEEDKLIVGRAPAGSSASCRSRSSSPSSSPASRASTSSSRRPSRASSACSPASSTTCPNRRSTWSAASMRRSRRPRRWRRRDASHGDFPRRLHL